MGTKIPYQMQKCGDDVGLPENEQKNIAALFDAICLFLTSWYNAYKFIANLKPHYQSISYNAISE